MARFDFFVAKPSQGRKLHPASGQAVLVQRGAGALSAALRLAAGVGLCVASAAAWAHFPVGQCKALDEHTIQCKGGFSDGSNAPGLTLEVISYDEKTLVSDKLDKSSSITFKRPAVPFYILFDAGAGHTVEVDHTQVGS